MSFNVLTLITVFGSVPPACCAGLALAAGATSPFLFERLNISCSKDSERKMDDENYFCVRFGPVFFAAEKTLLTPMKLIMCLIVLEVKAMSRRRFIVP